MVAIKSKAKGKKVTTVAGLRKAKSLLSKKNGWIQGRYAQDKDGKSVPAYGYKGVSFCMLGVIENVANHADEENGQSYYSLYTGMKTLIGKAIKAEFPRFRSPAGIVGFNDNKKRTKEEVLTVLDTAIALAKELPKERK